MPQCELALTLSRAGSVHLQLPSLRMALIQFAVSSANWLVMGTIIWLLLARQVDYPQVLGVLLISSI